jgi:hypothetical protein
MTTLDSTQTCLNYSEHVGKLCEDLFTLKAKLSGAFVLLEKHLERDWQDDLNDSALILEDGVKDLLILVLQVSNTEFIYQLKSDVNNEKL